MVEYHTIRFLSGIRKSVSFPNINTGIYCFPKKLVAEIALEAIYSSLLNNQNILQVNFVCFCDDNYEIYYSLSQ
nr:hypothetical protein [Xenorhabdus sp. Reich]